MEKKYWFVPKPYGWGLSPIAWQGWIAILVFMALTLAYIYFGYDILEAPELISSADIVRMIFDISIMGVAFVYIMEPKTDGKVTWRWG